METSDQLFWNAKEEDDQDFGELKLNYSFIRSSKMKLDKTQNESIQSRQPRLKVLID